MEGNKENYFLEVRNKNARVEITKLKVKWN